MKVIAFIASLSLLWTAYSQSPDITVYGDNVQSQFLVAAHYGGEQLLIDDSLHQNQDGHYTLPADALEEGIYIIADLKTSRFFDFIVDPEDESVQIRCDFSDANQRQIEGSPVNSALASYLIEMEDYSIAMKEFQEQEDSTAIRSLNEDMENMSARLKEEYPGSILETLINSQKKIIYPTISEDEEEQLKYNYRYRLDHYFDQVENDPRFWRSRFFKAMPKKYVKEFTISNPDSTYQSMKTVLEMVKTDEDVFKYYLVSWINEYAQSTILNHERVWVYLTQDYIQTGMADNFVPKDAKFKMLNRAEVQSKCFIGDKCQNLAMPILDVDSTLALEATVNPRYTLGKTRQLHQVQDSITILFFWKPSCGHCQEAYPELIELYKEYKDDGLGVYAVNVGSYKNYYDAAQFIKDHDGDIINNYVDPTYKSLYAQKYYIPTTPGIFILDADKKILFNRMGSSQLRQFTEKVLRDKKLIQ